ncbi:MAG: SusD/RagB family nutrient-binding outer membrane lipoprotein, partial [Rikenella sp.]|nr:SusD/RagB family nutrient-binding outer membrane lipoprotein [Rikenella sp.]
MRTYKKYILGAAVLSVAVLTGCKDKMRELNTNQNLMTSALPEYQFLGATQDWGFFGRGWPASRAGNIGALMQVSVHWQGSNPYVNPTTWSGGNMSFMNNYYNRYYSGGKGLNSIVTYIDKMEDPVDRQRYADIRAIARLLQMHEAWTVFTNYGAMVFSEAFQAQSEKIIKPAYDVYSKEAGIYKQLDDSVKMCIAQLASPMFSDAVALGRYDGFYGLTYTTKAAGGATWTDNKAEVQREKWLKFATTLRVKMALALRNVDPEYYQSVIGEVRQFVTENPNAMMSEVQDGCQFILPNTYNRDDGNQAAFYYCMPMSFINSMKLADDPRLPLVVTPTECDINYNQYYKFVATYYPDSLLYK